MADQVFRYPSSAQVTVTAIGTNGTPIPSSSILIGAEDPSGDLQPLMINASDELLVAVSVLPLPTGAATLAEQQAQTALLTTIDADTDAIATSTASIDTKTPALIAGNVPVDVQVSVLPPDAATETTLALVAADTASIAAVDFATETTLVGVASGVSNISAQLPAALGQLAMAASLSVAIASDQSTLPVSIATVPLPTGAATLAEQQAQTALLTTIDADVDAIATSTAAIDASTSAIDTSTASIDTKTPALIAGNVPVDVQTSVLPTGAATEATLATLATEATVATLATEATVATLATEATVATLATETTLSSINTKTPALGQAAMAASVPVVIASNQTAIPVSLSGTSGSSLVDSVRNDYTSTSVTTGAWVQLIASTSGDVSSIFIFDSSGQTLELGVGAAASEVRVSIIVPGGNGQVPLAIASGSRVAVRAISATASVGELDINLYS